jgi:hypothetical protein
MEQVDGLNCETSGVRHLVTLLDSTEQSLSGEELIDNLNLDADRDCDSDADYWRMVAQAMAGQLSEALAALTEWRRGIREMLSVLAEDMPRLVDHDDCGCCGLRVQETADRLEALL